MKSSKAHAIRAAVFLSVALSCSLTIGCSKKGKSQKSGPSPEAFSSKGGKKDTRRNQPLPKFFGVYLVKKDGSYRRLTQVKEEVHRKMRPRPRARAGTSLTKALRMIQRWRRNRWVTTQYFPLAKDVPVVRAGRFSKTGVVVHLEKFVSLHIGASKVQKEWLVHKKKKHGWLGEEVAELRIKKLKESVYQIVPAKALPAGYYYLWIKKLASQKGFKSAFIFQISD